MFNNISGYAESIRFITSGGLVSIWTALVLALMSLATWYVMLYKGYQVLLLSKQFKQFEHTFWQSINLDAGLKLAANVHHPMSDLSLAAIAAAKHYQANATQFPQQNCSYDEFVLRSMRQSFANSSFRLESGLTLLATVGSIAPFVGLFGTVWGIYHALINISVKQQATLDAVAGPVGEALVMTAIGLAVAIPAVLAYNFILRLQRALYVRLEAFSSKLHVLLTTGTTINHRNFSLSPFATPLNMQVKV